MRIISSLIQRNVQTTRADHCDVGWLGSTLTELCELQRLHGRAPQRAQPRPSRLVQAVHKPAWRHSSRPAAAADRPLVAYSCAWF